MRTHYDVIGVSEDATHATIRATYLRLLKIYHPDHNSDPTAGQRTAEIIEAYSILSDTRARAEYDATLRPSSAAGAKPKDKVPDPEVVPSIVCQKCGVQNASLRVTLMYWVVSFILVTRRGGRSGVWCEKCRAKQAAIWSVLTGLMGWWGFPLGPIYTVPALYYNAIGGQLDKKRNAALLRLTGYQLYEKGHLQEALNAVDASIRLEHNQATVRFADSLRSVGGSSSSRKFPVFRVVTAMPGVAVSIALVTSIYLYLDQPSGYAARYTGANTSATITTSQVPRNSSGRDRVNDLVDQLATEVEAHATPAGSHHEGTTTINDYELDRAKYKAEPFAEISARLSHLLDDAVANKDGLSASAYFNATLMGLSVSVLNKFDTGEDISDSVNEVAALGDDDRIRPWLIGSKYSDRFSSLILLLKRMSKAQTIGVSREARRAMLKSFDSEIETAIQRIDEARRENEPDVEHSWVSKHNRTVNLYNELLTKEKRNHVLSQKADLAFNKCLDPAILMSKFQQVNLTHDEAAVNALPDN